MKSNRNKLFNLKKLTLMLILFSAIFQLSYAGELKHTSIDPYEDIVATAKGTYTSAVTTTSTTTIIDTRYKDFDYNSINIFGNEPYCKFGGQYMINVINNPGVEGIKQNITRKLYYCKTTQDLINQIKIPSSWSDSNLVFYCNDGNNIYNSEFNLDFVTSKINTYKLCVLKNLDLNEKNSIIYGFEAGNKLIDSYSQNYFNTTSKMGGIVSNLNNQGSASGGNLSTLNIKYFYVPYLSIEVNETDSSGNPVTNIVKVPRTGLNLTQYVSDYCSSNTLACDMTTLTSITSKVVEYSQYSISYTKTISQEDFTYKDSNEREYVLEYIEDIHYYVLRENNAESLSVPIKNVFNKNIGLSRVALFRSIDGKKIYGFESALKLEDSSKNKILPVYKIENMVDISFTQDLCMKTLARYSPQFTFNGNTNIACKANGDILINSMIIDDSSISNNQEGWSLNLFKNIILGVK